MSSAKQVRAKQKGEAKVTRGNHRPKDGAQVGVAIPAADLELLRDDAAHIGMSAPALLRALWKTWHNAGRKGLEVGS